jgi:hypothetical protein
MAAVLVALLAQAWAAASAFAAFYASPAGGAGPATNCTNPAGPYCTIEEVTTNIVTNGAEVVLTPGNYTPSSTVNINNSRNVHGQNAQPSATITSTSGPGVWVQGGAQLRDIRIEDNAGTALFVTPTPAPIIDRVFAHTTGGSYACDTVTGTIRDSVCWNTNPAGFSSGLGTQIDADTVTLRNVTTIATGTSSRGIWFSRSSSGTTTVSAKSVIASGAGQDVVAFAGPGTTTITLDHSDYATKFEGPGAATVTNPGSATNPTAAPLFANASTGDFHELAGSPTIDTGALDGSSGTTDLDGVAWGTPDIGAYEFVPPPPGGGGNPTEPTTPAKDTLPPTTTIGLGPKKRTHKRKAKFQFVSNEPGSTFMCKLDRKGFAPCTPPKTVRVKPGKHTFQVEAIDPSANADPTPAVFRWKVLSG